MTLDIRELKSRQFYTTNSELYPLAYILKISFEIQISKHLDWKNLEDFDYVVIRYLHCSSIPPQTVYFGGYSKLPEDKQLVALVNLPLVFDKKQKMMCVNFKNVQYELELVCKSYTSQERIYSQAAPYKFNHMFSVGRHSGLYTPDIAIDNNLTIIGDITDLIPELIGFDEFMYFTHYIPGIHKNGDTSIAGVDFYFKDLNLYNLVKISLESYK